MTLRTIKKLVVVSWRDAWSGGPWVGRNDDACAPSLIRSVGFLLEKNQHGVLLVSRIDDTYGNVGNRQFIPWGCIASVKTVKA